jgi:hypothetical protein
MSPAVAVTVSQAPYLVLDRSYTVVEVGDAASAHLASLLGLNLWESHPEAEPLFRAHLENAWRAQEPIEVVEFYEGRVLRIRLARRGDELQVSWEVLMQLDTLTLRGLRSSIDAAISKLEEHGAPGRRKRAPHRLRLIEGSA